MLIINNIITSINNIGNTQVSNNICTILAPKYAYSMPHNKKKYHNALIECDTHTKSRHIMVSNVEKIIDIKPLFI